MTYQIGKLQNVIRTAGTVAEGGGVQKYDSRSREQWELITGLGLDQHTARELRT
jgi:hypothetical protein